MTTTPPLTLTPRKAGDPQPDPTSMVVIHGTIRQDLRRLEACLAGIASRGAPPAQARAVGRYTAAPARPPAAPAEPLPCQRGGGELWFSELPAELEQAKASCQPCPLRAACLAGALERAEPWGVWGGEIFHQGAILARKRPRGRPRKTRPDASKGHYGRSDSADPRVDGEMPPRPLELHLHTKAD